MANWWGWLHTGGLCRRNLLLWEKTERLVPLDVFRLGQLRRNNSALTSRWSSTRTHLGNVHLGAVFKLIKLYLNCNGDQILTFISKVQPLELTRLILGCLALCTTEVCAGSICSCLWSAKARDLSVRSGKVQWYPWRERSLLFCCGAAEHVGGVNKDWRATVQTWSALTRRQR